MNAQQAQIFQIFLFKLRMDARWDKLPLRNISPPSRNRPTPPWKWKSSDLPLKFKTSKFQIPPNPGGEGRWGGGVHTMHTGIVINIFLGSLADQSKYRINH